MNLQIVFKNGTTATILNYQQTQYSGITVTTNIEEIVFKEDAMFCFKGDSTIVARGDEIVYVKLTPLTP